MIFNITLMAHQEVMQPAYDRIVRLYAGCARSKIHIILVYSIIVSITIRQQNDIVLMLSFVVVHVVVSFHLTRRRLKLSAAQPTKNCSRTYIITNNQYVLHSFLPLPSHASQNYSLRPRRHNFELPDRVSHLTDCNFIKRMLFSGIF